MDKFLLTPEEAADSLSVGRSTVYDLMRLNEIASIKIGRSRRIPVDALRKYVERVAAIGDER